jgi:hypothetical protein
MIKQAAGKHGIEPAICSGLVLCFKAGPLPTLFNKTIQFSDGVKYLV